jgi:hypothetical protein
MNQSLMTKEGAQTTHRAFMFQIQPLIIRYVGALPIGKKRLSVGVQFGYKILAQT